MTRSYAKAYEVVITTEDDHSVIVKFESTGELSKTEQKEKARQILLSIMDDVESGMVDMEVKPTKDVIVETTVTTETYTTED